MDKRERETSQTRKEGGKNNSITEAYSSRWVAAAPAAAPAAHAVLDL